MARRRGSQLHTSEVVMTGIARGVLFMSLLFSGCATRTPPTIEPHAPPRPPVPADVVDIRGIWRDKDLDAAGARARGLDPALIETPIKLLNVNPTYPPAARQAGIQGDVMAYCVIGVDGVLLEAVLSRQWTYNPDEVVETVIGVFPEVEAWWVDKTVGPHLYFWWAR